MLNRNRLYTLLFTACFLGYAWVYYNLNKKVDQRADVEVCLVKHLTKVPCPSCGSTRSVISLIQGNFITALNLNPLGYVIAVIMLVAPFWILVDVIMRSSTFFGAYKSIENSLKKPLIAFPLIILLILNWVWNIYKEI